MSAYETASLWMSGIAILLSIVIPVIQVAYKRFRKPNLRILPFEHQALKLYFNNSLNSIGINFSIACDKAPCIVGSIRATVVRKSDNKRMNFRWSLLEPVWINWANVGSNTASLNSASLARPLRLSADSLEPLSVSFEAVDRGSIQHITSAKDALYLKNPSDSFPYEHYAKYIRNDPDYRQLCTDIEQELFWVKGGYRLEIDITYDTKGIAHEEYNFELSDDQERFLRCNIDHIAICDGCPTKAACQITPRFEQVSIDL